MKRIRIPIGAPSTPEDRERLSQMLTARQAPGARYTDRAFMQDRCNGKQFENDPYSGDFYKQQAAKHGVSVTGKYYHTGLARFPGDPQAWIDSTSDIRRIAKERNLTVTGAVECQGIEMPPPPSVALAPDIVERFVNQKIAADPGLGQRKKRQELREEVIEKHAVKRKTVKR